MSEHTPGPWRFEFNAEHRRLHLVGGKPRYDLTIMDFCRWGMNGATIRLRDTAHDGMNIMHKLHEREDWIAPQPGREHHKSWHQLVTHPDIRLIEAAPDLLQALREVSDVFGVDWREGSTQRRLGDLARAAIAKATGGQT
jgi:hypothetical protein